MIYIDNFKKVLALMLSLVMVLGMMPVGAAQAQAVSHCQQQQ